MGIAFVLLLCPLGGLLFRLLGRRLLRPCFGQEAFVWLGVGWLTWVISVLLLRDILYGNLRYALVVKGSFLF
jgi:hypothetical protein